MTQDSLIAWYEHQAGRCKVLVSSKVVLQHARLTFGKQSNAALLQLFIVVSDTLQQEMHTGVKIQPLLDKLPANHV